MGKNGKNKLDYGALPLLVTGGAGYIGSHMVIELIICGFTNIVIIDNFSNSTPLAIPRIKEILKRENIRNYKLTVYNLSLHDNKPKLYQICHKHKFFACLHFAGLKAIGESVVNPLKYYHNNLNSTLNLLQALQANNCWNFIFSSSASVYGASALQSSPVTEQSEVCHGIPNTYGWTKAFSEQILIHNAQSNPLVNTVILRYFNPIGAHKSGLIGEDPVGSPSNLMPYLLQVAVGRRECLHIFGNDYNTIDGTGVRDYIHVVDLAQGHVLALEMDIIPKWLEKQHEYLTKDSHAFDKNKTVKIDDSYKYDNKISIYNLGTGKGTSVLQMLHALEKACGHKIKYRMEERRPGDVDNVFADCTLAQKTLGFTAKFNIEQACEDSWRWQKMNPMGYSSNFYNYSYCNNDELDIENDIVAKLLKDLCSNDTLNELKESIELNSNSNDNISTTNNKNNKNNNNNSNKKFNIADHSEVVVICGFFMIVCAYVSYYILNVQQV